MEERTATRVVRAPEPLGSSAGIPFFELTQEVNELIARRAYELFESRGFTHGHHLEDWQRAESEILHRAPLVLTETETGFILRAEVPGFTENDVEVRAEPRRLYITGKRREATKQTEGKTVYAERHTNHIFRVLDLPASVDPNEVDAMLSDGVLEIRLCKTAVGRKIPVLARSAFA